MSAISCDDEDKREDEGEERMGGGEEDVRVSGVSVWDADEAAPVSVGVALLEDESACGVQPGQHEYGECNMIGKNVPCRTMISRAATIPVGCAAAWVALKAKTAARARAEVSLSPFENSMVEG